jgi:DNA-binding PadR family transcriptional regulator
MARASAASEPAPESFLPLTAVVFEILLALSGSELHGYEIMREVEGRSAGRVSLHAGSLYRALHRLLHARLVDEVSERPDAKLDDERRRYYRLTALGRAVAIAEARRLASQVNAARERRLLKGSAS